MNTKIQTLAICVLAFSLLAPAAVPKSKTVTSVNPISLSFSILARINYMLPSEQAFTDVYGSGLLSYGGELRLNINSTVAMWMEGAYLNKVGKLTYTQEETTVTIIPLEFGLLIFLMKGPFAPYIGAGGGYYIYKETNTVMEDFNAKPFGFCAIAGFSYTVGSTLLLDARFKYQYCTVTAADTVTTVNIGGIHFSAGLGVTF